MVLLLFNAFKSYWFLKLGRCQQEYLEFRVSIGKILLRKNGWVGDQIAPPLQPQHNFFDWRQF